VPLDADSGPRRGNFAALAAFDWQVHVYGAPSPEVARLCAQREIALHAFDWRPEMQKAGLARNAVYLVRPDGYVALADASASAGTVESYLDTRGLRPLAAARAAQRRM
jgi:hypothetical protein